MCRTFEEEEVGRAGWDPNGQRRTGAWGWLDGRRERKRREGIGCDFLRTSFVTYIE